MVEQYPFPVACCWSINNRASSSLPHLPFKFLHYPKFQGIQQKKPYLLAQREKERCIQCSTTMISFDPSRYWIRQIYDLAHLSSLILYFELSRPIKTLIVNLIRIMVTRSMHWNDNQDNYSYLHLNFSQPHIHQDSQSCIFHQAIWSIYC